MSIYNIIFTMHTNTCVYTHIRFTYIHTYMFHIHNHLYMPLLLMYRWLCETVIYVAVQFY